MRDAVNGRILHVVRWQVVLRLGDVIRIEKPFLSRLVREQLSVLLLNGLRFVVVHSVTDDGGGKAACDEKPDNGIENAAEVYTQREQQYSHRAGGHHSEPAHRVGLVEGGGCLPFEEPASGQHSPERPYRRVKPVEGVPSHKDHLGEDTGDELAGERGYRRVELTGVREAEPSYRGRYETENERERQRQNGDCRGKISPYTSDTHCEEDRKERVERCEGAADIIGQLVFRKERQVFPEDEAKVLEIAPHPAVSASEEAACRGRHAVAEFHVAAVGGA